MAAIQRKVSKISVAPDTGWTWNSVVEEMHPSTIEYKAFVFYCLMYCVDFMGERGMQFLDKTIPVNQCIIQRLNDIYDMLLEEWENCCKIFETFRLPKPEK